MKKLLFLFSFFLPYLSSAEDLKFPSTPPTEPKDTTKSFHVLDGFELQLIAAEPLVTDPVAITYDEDGRAFVCEMNDYPYTDKELHKHAQENPTDQAIGKVRLLTDTDGDGVFDKATIFADGLSWPTGAACWKGGIFVTATPDVWYLKDTNNDGVADVRVKVFTGFKKLNVQAVMNNPIWGLDHRIYVAGGSNGGELQRVPGSESVMPLPKDFKTLAIKRNDFSFDPSTGDVRLESGGARFGNTFDDWGNRFLCNIRNPCQHVVLPYRYLARNPYLVVPSALNDCAEAGDQLPVYRTSPAEPWREFRAKRWVQEGSTLPKSELVGAGVVTSSSGITVYRGDAYPAAYRDFAFVADVAGNLFYRMKLVPDGVTFKAVQVDGTKNFCTSDDLWFRPVNFVNAPDGCLHVCDMYREVIEHPWSIPDDIHAALDLLRGRDKGRVYRLAPSGFKHRPTPKLSQATAAELVALLDHPNAWHRDAAQRLLFERQDKAAVEPLRAMVKEGKTPQGRVAALWGAQGIPRVDPSTHEPITLVNVLNQGFVDDDPFVRAAAVMIASNYDDDWPLIGGIKELRTDTAMMVRFQASFVLANVGINGWTSSLADIVVRDYSEPWVMKAVMSSPLTTPETFWELLHHKDFRPEMVNLLAELGNLMAREGRKVTPSNAFDEVIESRSLSELAKNQVLIGIGEGSASAGIEPRNLAQTQSAKAFVDHWLKSARQTIAKPKAAVEDQIQAMKVLRLFESFESTREVSAKMLLPTQPTDLQLAALEALGSYREPAVADMLVDAWKSLTPPLRDKALTLMLSRTDRIAKLLDAIEAKRITPAQLSVAAKATLGRQKIPALAQRIAKLIGDGNSSNRKEVIEKYQVALSMTGDPTRGAKVYETACQVCHRHVDRGNDVGPNLGTIKAWTPEQVLTNVLDPNREVSPNFALYLIETNDGRSLTGLIANETAGNLMLKLADGSQQSLLRSDIKSLVSPGISLMPEGLEAAITPQQMADLIAFLKL